MDKPAEKLQPNMLKGSVNLLKQIAGSPEGRYKSWEQMAIDNVLTELKRLQKFEVEMIARGITV